jgi:hypothetical protein
MLRCNYYDMIPLSFITWELYRRTIIRNIDESRFKLFLPNTFVGISESLRMRYNHNARWMSKILLHLSVVIIIINSEVLCVILTGHVDGILEIIMSGECVVLWYTHPSRYYYF